MDVSGAVKVVRLKRDGRSGQKQVTLLLDLFNLNDEPPYPGDVANEPAVGSPAQHDGAADDRVAPGRRHRNDG